MSESPEDLSPYAARLGEWIATYHYGHFIKTAQELPLRRDMLTLLTYVDENKVTGTRSTGNMPLKHIRAVTAQFVEPPVLDEQIGDRTFQLRTESQVWPLYLLHILAEASDLLITPEGVRWRLTEAGVRYLEGDPMLQVLALISTWWYRIDWRVASHYQGSDLPDGFEMATLALLLSTSPNLWVEVESLADKLVKRTGWRAWAEWMYDAFPWHVWDTRTYVVNRMVEFGVFEARYIEERVGSGVLRKATDFRLTWFGKALLEGLRL